MKSKEEVLDRLKQVEESKELQMKLRDVCPKGSKDYYDVDRQVDIRFREVALLKWFLVDATE